MKRTVNRVILVCVVLALSMGAQPVSGQPDVPKQLSITDLGTLPGGTYSAAHDINDRGQVIGQSNTASGGDYHAFLWDKGQMIDLGTLPGENFSAALGINSAGQVVGYGQSASGESHALLWTK